MKIINVIMFMLVSWALYGQNSRTFYKFGITYDKNLSLNSQLSDAGLLEVNNIGAVLGLYRYKNVGQSKFALAYGVNLIEQRSQTGEDAMSRQRKLQLLVGPTYQLASFKGASLSFGTQIGLSVNHVLLSVPNSAGSIQLGAPQSPEYQFGRTGYFGDVFFQLMRTEEEDFIISLKIGTWLNYSPNDFELVRSGLIWENSPSDSFIVPYLTWEFTWPYKTI